MKYDWLIIICSALGAAGGLFGIFSYLRACRKPRARLRFSNGKKRLTFSPHYCRAVARKYYVGPPYDSYDASAYEALVKKYNEKHKHDNEFVLSFRLTNTGRLQLENYRVEIEFNGIQSTSQTSGQPRRVIGSYIEPPAASDIIFNREKPQIVFSPLDKSPLNQNDYKEFSFIFSPHPEAEQVVLRWRISAKDFSKSCKLVVNLKPIYDEYTEIHFKNCERDVPPEGELIEDLKPYIEQMRVMLDK